MKVVEHDAKFGKLVKFCPYYNDVAAERSKCIKFESGMHHEVKH